MPISSSLTISQTPTQPVAQAANLTVEVSDADGHSWAVPLRSDHVLIGRSPYVDIQLDRNSVSRRHAEMLRDPFGRWWIRDLQSRTGTRVNGVAVQEINLQPGDLIEISRFSLIFNPSAQPARPATSSALPADAPAVPYEDTTATRIQTLQEVEAPKIDTLHLTTLSEFGQRLTSVEDPQERIRLLCRFMVRRDFHGFVAMALRYDKSAPEDPLRVLVSQKERRWSDQGSYVSRHVIETLQRTRTALIASNDPNDSGVIEMSSPGDAGPIATIACPLNQDGNVFDLLYVILPSQYGTGEWLALVELAVRQYQQAESVWHARNETKLNAAIEQDLASARKIQLSLVPRKLNIEGLDVAIDFQPSRWVGGDYVDVVSMQDGKTLLVAADVSGKGLPASLVSLSLHSVVHTCISNGIGMLDMMATLNGHLCSYTEDGAFVTLACVAIDTKTGELWCVNAGHLPPVIIDADGTRRPLQMSKHFPLGLQEMEFDFDTDRLEPGQLLAMYTDGLTEVPGGDGKLIGVEGLGAELSQVYRTADGATCQGLADRVTEWLDELEGGSLRRDDRSLLLAQRRG